MSAHRHGVVTAVVVLALVFGAYLWMLLKDQSLHEQRLQEGFQALKNQEVDLRARAGIAD